MEWLANLINGTNGIFALLFGLVALVILVYLVKSGMLNFNAKGLSISTREKELDLIRKQLQYVNNRMDATIRDLPVRLTEGLHYYFAKYVISKVKDCFEEAVIYNNMEEGSYIELKQELIYNVVLKITKDDYFKSPEFKVYLYDLVEKTLQKLIKLRKESL